MKTYKVIFIDGSELILNADSYAFLGPPPNLHFKTDKGTVAQLASEQVRAIADLAQVVNVK